MGIKLGMLLWRLLVFELISVGYDVFFWDFVFNNGLEFFFFGEMIFEDVFVWIGELGGLEFVLCVCFMWDLMVVLLLLYVGIGVVIYMWIGIVFMKGIGLLLKLLILRKLSYICFVVKY